jgi:hypothetical protein
MSAVIDVGDQCVDCGQDTKFGSGRFVNRIPADRLLDDGTYRDGWLCAECQAVECERCGEQDANWRSTPDGQLVCPDCFAALGLDGWYDA